ncbi:putative mediator of RNA polymerase II transcription subunit 19-A [Trichinella spiralis]|uniref:putative mediator of RNA polymerase II transcription subunit 19-A n=1 Tax=Trichinella spiralis TaxID=6334 RepID=UPI0001EFC059|nr:putative mediator of RNA polymerase II transcription subunit 19-A [Trichinella spiralis]
MDESDSASVSSSQTRDSSGILRTKIALGRKPSVIMPFYMMKNELPSPSPITGSMNLLSYYGLDHAFNKFCNNKKLKEELSAFLPNLPGNIDTPAQKDGRQICSNFFVATAFRKASNMWKRNFAIEQQRFSRFSSSTWLSRKLHFDFRVKFRILSWIPEEYQLWNVGAEIVNDKKKRKRKHELLSAGESAEDDVEKRLKRMKKEEEKKEKKKKKKDKKKKKMMESEPVYSAPVISQASDFLDF